MDYYKCPLLRLKAIYYSPQIWSDREGCAILFIKRKHKAFGEVYFEFEVNDDHLFPIPLMIGFQYGEVGQVNLGGNNVWKFEPKNFLRDYLGNLLADYMMREFDHKGSPDFLYINSLSTALMSHLLRVFFENGHKVLGLSNKQVHKLHIFILAHLDHPITVKELASVVGLSEAYFSKKFKKSLGESPYKYVLRQRMERAKRLLATTDKSVIQIAFDVGIDSHSQFCQSFKRFFGLTPSDIRKLDYY